MLCQNRLKTSSQGQQGVGGLSKVEATMIYLRMLTLDVTPPPSTPGAMSETTPQTSIWMSMGLRAYRIIKGHCLHLLPNSGKNWDNGSSSNFYRSKTKTVQTSICMERSLLKTHIRALAGERAFLVPQRKLATCDEARSWRGLSKSQPIKMSSVLFLTLRLR